MKSLKTHKAYVLALLLVATLVSHSWSAPKDGFQRRNWTPQAMLYLKGTQGRRFISEDRNEGDVYDTVHLANSAEWGSPHRPTRKRPETRSQKAEQLSVSRAAAVLLNFLQQAKEEEENADQVYFQELPPWKREYF